eukprot:TRINITY_DN24301_c0_g1_i1.p1 TRINITY_DN24301_c0_g1~~TRINITY_DN24301_c0_g1_i1.p1  ORF type:complete len:352 (-),score=42.16 TRINITY_DN24301_c0_g1_i1:248-1249(-)
MKRCLPSSSVTQRATRVASLVKRANCEDDTLDVTGILWLEHLNLLVGSKAHAEAFYKDFLGFTRDPSSSFHLNLGAQQLHLGVGVPHKLTGVVGLAVPSIARVRDRLKVAAAALAETQFCVEEHEEDSSTLHVTCPWGNTFMLYTAARKSCNTSGLPKMAALHAGLDEGLSVRGGAGIRYVEFRVRTGTMQAIAKFYREMFGCRVVEDGDSAAVCVGPSCHIVFSDVAQEPLTDLEEKEQAGEGGGEGLHVCIYVADFKTCYERLKQRGLIWTNPRFRHLDTCDSFAEAHASRQFRFKTIIDLDSGKPLLELEHECRALRHYQYMKQLHYVEA